ncbi:hypothetical protein [Pseudonocardia parietis]|uniref:Membrane-bound ClpP family serine protease n=1 Tax=Pseudonocardia parietis TaxID=570936 RepID=A0ABS4W3M7_9PSEU|nr:hypothetical protein [Pseudonocardia parietis]MBP2370616.1 membrane-bound ClpP family serine protease [Pseudonocardia parietis]
MTRGNVTIRSSESILALRGNAFGGTFLPHSWEGVKEMIILGVILLLVGWFTSISLLYYLGGLLVIIGVVLMILGAVGRPVGGRKAWF